MPLNPGTNKRDPINPNYDYYADSMAKAIEDAFKIEWVNVKGGSSPSTKDNRELKLLFVAIAQGVVKHLRDHPNSFKVETQDSSNTMSGKVSSIETTLDHFYEE